jgi:2TM domain
MPTPNAPGLHPASALHRPDHLSIAVDTVLSRRRHVAVHLLVYATVNTLLVVVWLSAGLISGSWFPWPLLSLAGWGLALQLHWWWSYGPLSRLVREEVLVRGAEPRGRP